MCGIIGFLGKLNKIDLVIQGLKMLQNRGYDSAGITTINDKEFYLEKKASTNTFDSVYNLEKKFEGYEGNSKNCIAHTRWATHGGKTDKNAHPHVSYDGRFSLVHNGIIENYAEIKKYLIEKEVKFASETDTEVIVNLIAYNYYLTQNLRMAIQESLSQIKGTWALLIQFLEKPNLMICAKMGSPLLFGKSKDGYIFCSEMSGFCNEVDEYHPVKDNHLMIVDVDLDKIYTLDSEHGVTSLEFMENNEYHILEKHSFDTSPDPYDHWMLKEIMEQPEAVRRCINFGGRIPNEERVKLGGIIGKRNELLKYKNIKILACGTSMHAGMYGAYFLKKWGQFQTVETIDASEFSEEDIGENILYIVLSQSGETKDVHRAIELIRNKTNDLIVSIVNVVASLISRESDCGVYINAGSEKAVASTKSFIGQALVLYLLSLWFSQERDVIYMKPLRYISEFPGKIEEIFAQKNYLREITREIKDQKHIFILGRNTSYPIALEGSLKIKEIGYIHAEGFAGGALKHGPFALIEEGTVIVLIGMDNIYFPRIEMAGEEVKARGAQVILITDKESVNESLYKHIIRLPKVGDLSSLLAVIPLQLISYYLSLEKGHNPDFPRNLAKVVTVDG